MRTTVALLLVAVAAAGACAPSADYQRGRGFFSERYARAQVEAAANAGRVKNLGRFSVDAGACLNYSGAMTDRQVVIPAIQKGLRRLGANVADHVVADEKWYDLVFGLFIVPALLGCSHWEVSGDALFVGEGAWR